jgi:hypothetical protein
VVEIEFKVFWLLHCVVWWSDTKILEGCAASSFRVEVHDEQKVDTHTGWVLLGGLYLCPPSVHHFNPEDGGSTILQNVVSNHHTTRDNK